LEEHERYRIEEIGEDGEPIAPAAYTSKFTRQCGVLVRDNIPITLREWKKTKMEPTKYVRNRLNIFFGRSSWLILPYQRRQRWIELRWIQMRRIQMTMIVI
jgi:hypothetical protein